MAKIKRERMIGLTENIEAALMMVEDFSGLKPSQYCRQAILEKLVRDGFMQHPAAARFQNNNPQPQNIPAE
jgi:hypothetical protein